MEHLAMELRGIGPDYDFATQSARSEMQRPEPNLRGDPYRNFYRRMADDLARQKPNLHNDLYQEPGAPVFRSGRLGAPWRHIRQCTGNLGNHICFVDGVVKQGDMQDYPPYGYNSASDHLQALAYVTPRTAGYSRVAHPMMRSATFHSESAPRGAHNKLRTSVNHRAKQNFKYWHEEKPYQGLPAKQTITGRLMAKGIGY